MEEIIKTACSQGLATTVYCVHETLEYRGITVFPDTWTGEDVQQWMEWLESVGCLDAALSPVPESESISVDFSFPK